ncbi:hypothetical protein DAPPUDRAFT_246720 [Daphnia pulex]|uniref:Uncharacterized protein n=1 Tax=Daphnia pulex TaxID=6669 RepID=E9GR40_DAPPU|nr:hypothetical protein DAPPUDRAFT_246720 [Daphnia pulex]|eukprot:EFX77943.1 hypothetical protein DAPPUDRAFT_246720 [Daphnia pulex]
MPTEVKNIMAAANMSMEDIASGLIHKNDNETLSKACEATLLRCVTSTFNVADNPSCFLLAFEVVLAQNVLQRKNNVAGYESLSLSGIAVSNPGCEFGRLIEGRPIHRWIRLARWLHLYGEGDADQGSIFWKRFVRPTVVSFFTTKLTDWVTGQDQHRRHLTATQSCLSSLRSICYLKIILYLIRMLAMKPLTQNLIRFPQKRIDTPS